MRLAVHDLAARPRRHEDGQRLGLHVEACGEQRAFDARPFSGRQLAHIGRRDAHGEQRAGMLVDDGRADRLGLAALVAGRAHQAGARLDDQVLRLAGEHRALAAPSGAARVDDVRLALPDVLVPEAETVHHAGAKILDHHVGLLDQRQDDLAAFGRLEIDREQALVAERAEIEAADAAGHFGAGPAARTLAAERLDLDDLRAHVAEVLGARRPLQHVAETHDLHPVEEHSSVSAIRHRRSASRRVATLRQSAPGAQPPYFGCAGSDRQRHAAALSRSRDSRR